MPVVIEFVFGPDIADFVTLFAVEIGGIVRNVEHQFAGSVLQVVVEPFVISDRSVAVAGVNGVGVYALRRRFPRRGEIAGRSGP